jgi:hypothetical protein
MYILLTVHTLIQMNKVKVNDHTDVLLRQYDAAHCNCTLFPVIAIIGNIHNFKWAV